MDHHHFQTILKGLAQRRISGSCQLPRGARVEFSEKTMMIGKKPDTPQPAAPRDNHPIALALPGIIQLRKENVYRIDPDQKTGQKIQSIRTDIFPGGIEELAPFQSTKTVYEEVIDRDRLEGGLELRTRNPGDSFHPLGAPGGKKLGDFFTDHKIPKNIRDSIGLIYDQAGIVWVPGLRIAERVKVTSATRTLLKFTLNESG